MNQDRRKLLRVALELLVDAKGQKNSEETRTNLRKANELLKGVYKQENYVFQNILPSFKWGGLYDNQLDCKNDLWQASQILNEVIAIYKAANSGSAPYFDAKAKLSEVIALVRDTIERKRYVNDIFRTKKKKL